MPEREKTIASLEKWIEVAMHLSMRNFIRFSKENNMSMSQIGTLFHLRHNKSPGVTDVGAHLGISSAAASQMIDRLVQQKLIERSEDPQDRRIRQLKLTEEGQSLLQGSIRARQSWTSELAAMLSPAEHEQVTQVLNLLIEKSQLLDAQTAPDTAA